ncbi:Elongation of fatty acids protein [Plasmodiophora brassicae]
MMKSILARMESSTMMTGGVALMGCIFYIVTMKAFWPSKSDTRRPISRVIVFLHNILLMVFSIWIFLSTAPDLFKYFIRASSWSDFALTAYQDAEWDQFAPFASAFYLSKFYEFIDTWIILYKRGRPEMLQMFHHVGAVITMWADVVTKCPATWIFVVFNSFIHTFMYAYYALTSLHIRPPWKMMITAMQIMQFIIGIGVSYAYFAVPGALNPRQTMAISLTQGYVGVVLYLFIDFAYRTYYCKTGKARPPKMHEA